MIYPEEHLNRLKEIMILPVIEKLNLNPEDEPTFWKEFNKQLKENFGSEKEYEVKKKIAEEFHFNEFEEYKGTTKNQFYMWFTSVFRNSYLKLKMEGKL